MERKRREGLTSHPVSLVKGEAPIKCQPVPQSMRKMPILQLSPTHAPPVTLEKRMSHLLAISIYLAALTLTHLENSKHMFISTEEPAITMQFTGPLFPQSSWYDCRELLKRVCGSSTGLDYFYISFVKGESISLSLQ